MQRIDFSEITAILPGRPVISISGAGGKTTLLFRLAELFPGPVVLTTTTKVGAGQITAADQLLSSGDFPPEKPGKVIWVSPSLIPVNGKISGFTEEGFTRPAAVCRTNGWPLIAETDGAARRHLKAPAAHEPVIPAVCNVCFYLAGLDVIGKLLNEENVHRPEIFSRLTGLPMDAPVTPSSTAALLDHPEGGLKNMPQKALRIAYFTHADNHERLSAGLQISDKIKAYDYVMIG